jgi:hypothetical protein
MHATPYVVAKDRRYYPTLNIADKTLLEISRAYDLHLVIFTVG